MTQVDERAFGAVPHWSVGKPRIRPRRLLLQWATSALALYIAAMIVPGVRIEGFLGAFVAAAFIAVLNALLPPLIAALRLPYMLAVGFLLVLLLDAWMVLVAADLSDRTFDVNGFFWALLVALMAAAVTVVLEVLLGTNDDDVYSLRVTQRIARRSKERQVTDVPGIVYLEIDGLARPVLQRAMRDGHAPEMARWLGSGSHTLSEWETDLSSQTGASQAGLLLGSNDGIPAFRPPESNNARKTLTTMAVLCISMFLGLTVLAFRMQVLPKETVTIVSQVTEGIFGRGFFYYCVQTATALILIMAVNTSFADFPRLSYFLARDRFMPQQFQYRGDRLAFSTGIVALAVLAAVLGAGAVYFPMQNWLKIESSKSSVAVWPTTSPTAFTATCKSTATRSSVRFVRNASSVSAVASRARRSAS